LVIPYQTFNMFLWIIIHCCSVIFKFVSPHRHFRLITHWP
jgi:hypothetical protein